MSVINSLPLPPTWRRRRFDQCFVRSQRSGQPEFEPLSVFLDAGVVPRSSRSDNYNQLGADLSRYLVVERGDLVFNKLRTWQGGFGHSAYRGIVSPAYFVVRPMRGVASRFVDYLLHSAPYRTELVRVSKWQPPSQFDTPWEQLKVLPLLLPSLTHQEAIADLLEVECARIDALRRALSRLSGLIGELHEAAYENTLAGQSRQAIKRLDVTVQQGWSPEAEDRPPGPGEVAVLKLSGVSSGVFREEHAKTLTRASNEQVRRYAVHQGDLLMVRASGSLALLGRCARVTERPAGTVLFPDIVYRLRSAWVPPEVLAASLSAPGGRAAIEALKRGAANNKLRIQDVRNLEIAVPHTDRLDEVAHEISAAETVRGRASSLIDSIERRLVEYRDALITEAVTGQLDVAKAEMDERAHAVAEVAESTDTPTSTAR